MFNLNLPPIQSAGQGQNPKPYTMSMSETEEFPRWATDGSGQAEALINISGREEVTRIQFNFGNQHLTLVGRERELTGRTQKDIQTSKRVLEQQLKMLLRNK